MATFALDFEKPLLELEQKLSELKRATHTGSGALGDADTLDVEIRRLEKRCKKLQQEIFNDLSFEELQKVTASPLLR